MCNTKSMLLLLDGYNRYQVNYRRTFSCRQLCVCIVKHHFGGCLFGIYNTSGLCLLSSSGTHPKGEESSKQSCLSFHAESVWSLPGATAMKLKVAPFLLALDSFKYFQHESMNQSSELQNRIILIACQSSH